MKRSFTTNEFYHIFDRGVDKRKIFLDKNDYLRFIHDLYEFNDVKPALPFSRRNSTRSLIKKSKNVGSRVSNMRVSSMSNIKVSNIMPDMKPRDRSENRDILVKIHAFVLMPNHYHILLEQAKENGVSLFMRKLHTGYTKGFNLKHKRVGHLLQGPFKSIQVENDIHLGFLICYLHANVLDLWRTNWKKEKLNDSDFKKVFKFLEGYQWSSHLDYLGIKNFPSVINREFLLDFFDGAEGYKNFFIDWLKQYKNNIKHIKDLVFKEI